MIGNQVIECLVEQGWVISSGGIKLTNKNKPFEAEKTFGLSILLKLVKKNVNGIEIFTNGKKITANVSMDELNKAVGMVLKTHHIRLKVH